VAASELDKSRAISMNVAALDLTLLCEEAEKKSSMRVIDSPSSRGKRGWLKALPENSRKNLDTILASRDVP